MINELAESAREELKRADHSIYVSLKYTRTVDIIKNTIKRLLAAFDISIVQCLEYVKLNKKINTLPPSARQRSELLLKFYPKAKKSIEFYYKMKKIDRADYTGKEEFRKNVALIAKVAGRKTEVNTEILREYFDYTVNFVNAISLMTSKEKFLDSKKVTIMRPVIKKKDKKKIEAAKKTAEKKAGKKTVKKPAQKPYKINPSAPKRWGMY
tara:strand:+ start:857 stop:1486 length:630 start_codon:yes stop_codon:yes gene_type:complete